MSKNNDLSTTLVGMGPVYGRDLSHWLNETGYTWEKAAQILRAKVTTLRRLASDKNQGRVLPAAFERKLVDAWSATKTAKADITTTKGAREHLRGNQNIAVTPIIDGDGYRLGAAVRNEPGYTPFKPDSPNGKLRFASHDEAQTAADAMNEAKGLDKETAMEIVLSSMGRQIAKDAHREGDVYDVVIRLRVGLFGEGVTRETIREQLQDAIETNEHVIKIDGIEVTPT